VHKAWFNCTSGGTGMHIPRWADFKSPARRSSGALLLLTIAGLLIAACGGGGGGGSGGSGNGSGGGDDGSAVCFTSPNPAGLAWEPVPDPTMILTGYRIYYGTEVGTYSQVVDVASGVATVTVPGLSRGTTYYFAATAVDTSKNESIYSNEVCITIS
jgi:hypothetical protein